ncbi:peroxide stress protein YaaA [Kibdelosporangium persicum]|uniref:Peroxide stress protein YaaA n=1 Tax=Kibdelosporangium persicum TaxID=2698649 RepID=A0ABX2FJ19_9PSEU|nr:peroxide stress protein YaaA [Kibdelosporangium persicum]NRN71238.1 Peroxide stress protein YaaA [Kibdelosporangium persicum]
MLVLLPPSETKAEGGNGPSLDLTALSFPELEPVRGKLVSALVDLASDVPASLAALGLSDRQSGEVARNAALRSSPTMPALSRYTGVLYDALDVSGMKPGERKRASGRLAVASALFGLVRADDPVPAYRLSASSALPGVGPLGALWRPALEPVLARIEGPVVDMRSGPYAGLARIPGAITVKVVSEQTGGRRLAVTHFNKAHKGKLARALACAPAEPDTVRKMITVAAKADLRLEQVAPGSLELVI